MFLFFLRSFRDLVNLSSFLWILNGFLWPSPQSSRLMLAHYCLARHCFLLQMHFHERRWALRKPRDHPRLHSFILCPGHCCLCSPHFIEEGISNARSVSFTKILLFFGSWLSCHLRCLLFLLILISIFLHHIQEKNIIINLAFIDSLTIGEIRNQS